MCCAVLINESLGPGGDEVSEGSDVTLSLTLWPLSLQVCLAYGEDLGAPLIE